MSQDPRPQGRKLRRLGYTLLLVMVAKLGFEIPVDMGWFEGESVVALARGVAFALNMLLILLAFGIVAVWPWQTRYNRMGKILITAYLGLYMLGMIARRLGLSNWLETQGRTLAITAYALSSLVMAGLLMGITVIAVLDLQERTNRDIRTRLHGKGPSDKQAGAIAEASRPEPGPTVEKARAE